MYRVFQEGGEQQDSDESETSRGLQVLETAPRSWPIVKLDGKVDLNNFVSLEKQSNLKVSEIY